LRTLIEKVTSGGRSCAILTASAAVAFPNNLNAVDPRQRLDCTGTKQLMIVDHRDMDQLMQNQCVSPKCCISVSQASPLPQRHLQSAPMAPCALIAINEKWCRL
jgi:hypothetical protein